MVEENEEVVTAITGEGDTNVLVCKTDEENEGQKICMDTESERASTQESSNRKGMLDNNTYDLLEQLSIENKSLWRIKNNYKNDAASDNESKELWNFIEKDKIELIKLLTEKLRERL